MTEIERLAKNQRIKEKGCRTRAKRKEQLCRVFRLKIDISHLNQAQRKALKILFVEAKWLYNHILTFIKTQDINSYDYKVQEVCALDKNRNPVVHKLEYISSHMKQSIIHGIKSSLKSLGHAKKKKQKVGSLRYKSSYSSINLQQYGITYKFYDSRHIKIQGIKGPIKIEGAEQFLNVPEIEYANARLLNLPDSYYIAVTTFQNKGGETSKYKPPIGIDFGIKTSITTSEGTKYKVYVGETERLKKLRRSIARRKKGSNNRYRTQKLLRKEYQKLTNRKRDAANKIVHELLEHERIYMQDENIKSWKSLFGRTIQHSILGLVKIKLIKFERVVILPKSAPTTKYCPHCGKLKKDLTLADRIFECECGYKEDRDVHAARNMMLLSAQIIPVGRRELTPLGNDTGMCHARSRRGCKTQADHRGATS